MVIVRQGLKEAFGYNDALDTMFRQNGYDVETESVKFLRGYRTIIIPKPAKDKFKAPSVLGFTIRETAGQHGGEAI